MGRRAVLAGDVAPGSSVRRSGDTSVAEVSHGREICELLDAEDQALTVNPNRRRGRGLQALSLADLLPDEDLSPEGIRLLRKAGFDRTRTLEALRGTYGGLLLAWTDERDPFGLPGAADPGYTITLLRKVVSP